jgi:RND family efflux transporter MFP subunit
LIFATATLAAGCSATASDSEQRAAAPAAISVTTGAAVEQPMIRFISVSGTLTAEEEAEVAAETAGRVIATPVERGTRVAASQDLVRIAAAEATAQAQEAEANAAQIEARLGMGGGAAFEIERVPEVANAHAAADQAQADFDRVRMLMDRKLVSQSEFEQRRTQADAARRQYDVARNGAEQQYQSLLAARARVTIARKALADTAVHAPFAGVVAERFVSVGDYVTRGTKVAVVMRTNPLRVELTVPEQYISALVVGRPVTFQVDSYPGETFTGRIRYVSPALTVDSRSLVVEAVVANETGRLKPGFFATARIEEPSGAPGVAVPAAAVRTTGGTARVFIVAGDHVEERIVTVGVAVKDAVEISSGLKPGDIVATSNVAQLTDGARVAVAR